MTDRQWPEPVIQWMVNAISGWSHVGKETQKFQALRPVALRWLNELQDAGWGVYQIDATPDDMCGAAWRFATGLTTCTQPIGHDGPHVGPMSW